MGRSPEELTVMSPDGTELGAVRIGSGEPLMLVHGAWNWREHWQPVAEELADTRTCWVMDRRGRGTSSDGDEYRRWPPDPSLVADEVRTFLTGRTP